MDGSIVVAIISAGAAVTVAALSYAFTKRRESDADWRKFKLDHYKEYILALSGVVGERSTALAQVRYSDAVNFMTLVAPPAVLRALYGFQDEIRASNQDKSQVRHDQTLARLLRAIRVDVHPSAPEDDDLVFRLMDAPGPTSRTNERGLPDREQPG